MTIGIDGNEANVTKRVGISEYAYQLLRYFSEFAKRDEHEKTTFIIYLKQPPLSHLPEETKRWHYKIVGPSPLWTQIGLPMHLFFAKEKPAVFFSPTHYAPRFCPMPSVISIMDLSFLRFGDMFTKKDLYQLKNWTAYSVKRAKKILTISNASRNDIIDTYHVPEEKVQTIYPGIKESLSLTPHVYSMNQLQAKYHVSDRYILFVGTLQPRKNIVRLIEAFARVKNQKVGSNNKELFEKLQLVIIGKRGWLYEEILAAPAKYGVSEDVKIYENVNDEDLHLFYKKALCYVLPSLYEGFGLPVLEAMQQGCPVITSSVSSMPEAGGDAAVYVNPQEPEDIAKKITQVISDESMRKELIEKGKKQVAKFSWEKAAKETLTVLQEVGEKKRR